tara:strand:+ start:6357 stop:6938 length:582 start_codon:yes stop_codon:yes gene_type:complete
MDEHKIDESTFIGGWYMPENVCDDIMQLYDLEKDTHAKGMAGGGVNEEIKKSTEKTVFPQEFYKLDRYLFYLQECLDIYKEKFSYSNRISPYKIVEGINIQRYKPGEGFYRWHCENMGLADCSRHLAFMTYLNTLDNAGTEFYYQKLSTPCVKGLTVIWPVGWTHTHRGVINNIGTKTIITGWYNFFETMEGA